MPALKENLDDQNFNDERGLDTDTAMKRKPFVLPFVETPNWRIS